MNKKFQLLFAIASIVILNSCGSGDKINADNGFTHVEVNPEEAKKSEFQSEKVNKIFFSIPSPMEMAELLQGSGSKYNSKYLNDINNRDKYASSYAKAINLGIYGADLSYTSVYSRNQESILYMSSAKSLADELGVSAAFDGDVMDRVEENLENRDSLLSIISETYFVLDSYLKENNRSSVSAQVISGGWLEGLYIAACVYEQDENKSEDLINRIIDQKYALDDMILLVDSYNNKGDLDEIKNDFLYLKTVFDKSETVKVDKINTDKNVLGSNEKLTMSKDNMEELVLKVKEIRGKYVSV